MTWHFHIIRDCYYHDCHTAVFITQQRLNVCHLILLYGSITLHIPEVKRSKISVTILQNNLAAYTSNRRLYECKL